MYHILFGHSFAIKDKIYENKRHILWNKWKIRNMEKGNFANESEKRKWKHAFLVLQMSCCVKHIKKHQKIEN